MAIVPTDLEALLGRRQGAAALTEIGFPITGPTLASKASRGGGPVYRRYGARVLYRWGDLLLWAQSRLSKPIRCTAELDVPMACEPPASAKSPEPAPTDEPQHRRAPRRRASTPASP
jgi:hypothetical protein